VLVDQCGQAAWTQKMKTKLGSDLRVEIRAGHTLHFNCPEKVKLWCQAGETVNPCCWRVVAVKVRRIGRTGILACGVKSLLLNPCFKYFTILGKTCFVWAKCFLLRMRNCYEAVALRKQKRPSWLWKGVIVANFKCCYQLLNFPPLAIRFYQN